MEINDSGRLKHQRLHKTAASEYESSFAKAQHIKSPRQEPSSSNSTNEDNIIKGEIIDLRFHDVKIRLEPSGQVITAKVSADVPLSIGQVAEFLISDKIGDQITLSFISSDITPINDLVYKALYSSGLTASERNLNIVQELLKYNMPIDKNTILSLIKLTSTYPDTDIRALTLMYKNKLAINTNSIAQFESYYQGTHQILNELNSLADIITNAIFYEADSTVINNDLIIQGDKQQDNELTTSNGILESDGKLIDSTNAYKSEEATISSNDNSFSSQIVSTDTDNNSANNIMNNHNITNYNSINNTMNYKNTVNNNSVNNNLLNNTMDYVNTIKNNTMDSNINNYFPDMQNLGSSYMTDSLLSLNKEILNIIIDGENRQIESLPGSMTLNELYTIVNDLYMTNTDKEKLITFLKTDTYQKLINDALHSRWTLNPKDLATPNKVTEYFKRLDEDLKKLQELFTSNKQSDFESVKSSVNKLQDNLQFMRDLNDLLLYVQLPLRLIGQDAHGDLYVFSKKKQALDLTDQVSLLLHLDMANLGPLDIHMTMKDRYVGAVFYLEKESESIIREHLNELIDLLSEKGYNLQAKTQVSTSKPDFITDILEQDVKEHTVYRHSFDIRA